MLGSQHLHHLAANKDPTLRIGLGQFEEGPPALLGCRREVLVRKREVFTPPLGRAVWTLEPPISTWRTHPFTRTGSTPDTRQTGYFFEGSPGGGAFGGGGNGSLFTSGP